jgi:flagellar hook-length control protein FliK
VSAVGAAAVTPQPGAGNSTAPAVGSCAAGVTQAPVTAAGADAAAATPAVGDMSADFRALFANLAILELPTVSSNTTGGGEAPATDSKPARDTSTADEQPTDAADASASTDLQAAIAAMSSLPWPVINRPVSLPAAASELAIGDGKARPTPAATSIDAIAQSAATAADAALSTPRTDTQASTKSLTQAPGAAADAAPLTLLSQAVPLTNTDSRSDKDNTAAGNGQRSGADTPGGQAIAELRASFSAVMDANTISAKVERQISMPVHDARWPAAVASEVRWCAQAGIQSATLRVVPDNLGPVELQVDVKDNRVNVSFTAGQAETRHALEDSLPRLREMLAGSGLTLGQASVHQEARRDPQFAAVAPRLADAESKATAAPLRRISIGLVDEYA